MIVVTGAAGFIGSVWVSRLNKMGYKDLILVDDFTRSDKNLNLQHAHYRKMIDRTRFIEWLEKEHMGVNFVFHLGARTDTTEQSTTIFNQLNLDYSKALWKICSEFGIPFVYASSAATYGDGSLGYEDSHSLPPELAPLNPYGISKNEFDKWALQQREAPGFWIGLKFFNVYGPNEYHKGRMASVLFHAYHQIKEGGKLKLFRSHRPDFDNGEQKRDFVYVLDLIQVLGFFMTTRKPNLNGIYNLGTGKAESFNVLAETVFSALGKEKKVEYIDTPIEIRDSYQYFTEANMGKLRAAGYKEPFRSLSTGGYDYVKEYLMKGRYY